MSFLAHVSLRGKRFRRFQAARSKHFRFELRKRIKTKKKVLSSKLHENVIQKDVLVLLCILCNVKKKFCMTLLF